MTALSKLFRITAFRLTLVYLVVFALFAAFLLGYFALNTRRLFTEQVTQAVDAEISGLVDHYNAGGIRRLTLVIEARSRRPGSSLYLLTTASGDGLAGNVGSLPRGVLDRSGLIETAYRRIDETETSEVHYALVRVQQLSGGFKILVGRDLDERDRLYNVVLDAGKWSAALVIVLGLLGGFLVARRMLRRVDAMTDTTQAIMGGDLSERLPVSGSGDELDRLAINLNEMLERIEALMHGLKEVSDNIAHDLKTPLTRLRNRAEEALRVGKDEASYRAALESTIEESDALIKTFNALLMIARAESGQARENMVDFDAAEAARSVAELYEPLAEEQGLSVEVQAATRLPVHGSRELIGQALANLLDNAIKYAAPAAKANDAPSAVQVTADRVGQLALLTVSDRGPGIPEGERGRAVERFVRLERSRSIPGSGLGLSLVAAVARLHGGELRLEDNAPGLRAVLVLPLAPVQPLAASANQVPAAIQPQPAH